MDANSNSNTAVPTTPAEVEALALDLGITAGEANALLTEAQRDTIAENNGDVAVTTQTGPMQDKAPAPAISPEDKARLEQLGQDTAREIENARSASDAVARTVLVERAREVAGKPAWAVAFLDGFASGLAGMGVKDSIVRARKSEAKAVIDAYARTIAEKLDDARAKLVEFTGGYHEFIVLARQIRGATNTKSPGTRAPKAKLNDAENTRARELVKSMSPGQAAETAVLIGGHILGMPDGEMAMIRMVANVYLQQLALSKDAGIAKWASDARDRAFAILDAHEKARPVTQVADHTAHGVLAIPQPAIAQQIAA